MDNNIKVIKLDEKELHIKQFNLNQMVQNASILIINNKYDDKSNVTNNKLLKHFSDISDKYIIANKHDGNNIFYESFGQCSNIHCKLTSDIVEKILIKQDNKITNYNNYKNNKCIEKELDDPNTFILTNEHLKLNEYFKLNEQFDDPNTFVLMDNCLEPKTLINERSIHELIFNGRHYKITYVLSTSLDTCISPEIRCNFDYVFLLANNNKYDIKKMYEHYCGMFPTLESFTETFNSLTEDGENAMVIVNRGAKVNFYDKVFWFKC